ncbi:MAG: hypothetical protein ACO1RX_23085 [Candidatus Sericytochromatia bacterium]
MSDQIMPIRADASGHVTFERVQVEEILIPENAPCGPASKSCGPSSDQINLSRPMRKHLQRKISTFEKAPGPQEQQQRDLRSNGRRDVKDLGLGR